MPCTEAELNIAMLDGCEIIWLVTPKEIISDNGKVSGLIVEKMNLGDQDASGRRSPVATGETFNLAVDMVIKAAGQTPYHELIENNRLKNKSGKIEVVDGHTNLTGVFAGGDCVNGGREVVDAVQAGKEGANKIMQYLMA